MQASYSFNLRFNGTKFERSSAFMIKFTIFCIAFLGLNLTACNNSASEKKFEFYYYPARNVYYDVANTQFVYSINGGKSWDTFKKNITADPATLGSRQIIYSDSPQPWDSNQAHIRLYNGKLFNVKDQDTAGQTSIISNKKIIKKAKQAEGSEPEKKPGFFKRLFGGKKHNNNQ